MDIFIFALECVFTVHGKTFCFLFLRAKISKLTIVYTPPAQMSKTQSISMACNINCKLKICITKNLIAHWCGFYLENNIYTMYTAIPFVEHKRWTLRRIFSAIVYRISKLSNVSSDIFRRLEFAIIVKITNLMWTISVNNAHYWNRWFLWARLFGKRTHIRCHLHA